MELRHKLVRDLEWAVHAPPLVVVEGDAEAEAAWGELGVRSRDRLLALDQEPAILEQFMADESKHPPCGRLQSYYGGARPPPSSLVHSLLLPALVQFWLSQTSAGEECHTHSRLTVARRRLSLEIKLLASLPGGLCLHMEPAVMFAVCDLPGDIQSAAKLVAVELDANLLHKLEIARFKCQLAQCHAVKRWVQVQMGSDRIASSIRVSGQLYLPFGPDVTHWWCYSASELIAATDHTSFWAIVDQRHMLSDANVISISRDKLHYTRGLDGLPELVPPVGSALPLEGLPDAPILKEQRGEAVRLLQLALVRVGLLWPSKIRYRIGLFGDNTAMAVGALQVLNGLQATGQYCAATRSVLAGLLAHEHAASQLLPWLAESAGSREESVPSVEGALCVMLPHSPLFDASLLCQKVQQRTDAGREFMIAGLPKAASEQSSAVRSAHEQLRVTRGAPAGHAEWVCGLSDAERWAMHDEAARALHVGHVSLGEEANPRMLFWKWHHYGGPGQCVQWDISLGQHTLIIKGVLAAGTLTATGASGEFDRSDRRIRQAFAKAVFTRCSDEGGTWWELLPAKASVFLGGQIPVQQERVCLRAAEEESRCFGAQMDLCGQSFAISFDEATIRPQGTREAAGLGKPAKRESMALIQVQADANGKLREVSRGFILAEDWHQSSIELSSDDEPRSKQQLHAETHVGKPLETDPNEWKVTGGKGADSAPVKPRRWSALTLGSSTDGAGFLSTFQSWRAVHNLGNGPNKRGRGLLHSRSAQTLLSAACFSTDAPYQLLVDIFVAAELAEDVELLQLVHAVVGAFPRTAPQPNALAAACKYTGEKRDLRLSMLRAICSALDQITKSLDAAGGALVSSGLCRLPLKAMKVVSAKEPLSAAAAQSVSRTTAAALQCVSKALGILQAEEHSQTEQLVAARAAALGVAIEVLLSLEHHFSIPDSSELIHWLVRGAEWSICEGLATDRLLHITLIEECMSVKNTKAVARFSQLYNVHLETPGLKVSTVTSLGDPQLFVLPEIIKVTHVNDAASLQACIDDLMSVDTPLVGIDAEWKPFVHAAAATPVALLQLATAHAVWLVDLQQLLTQMPSIESTWKQLWATLYSDVICVGFGLSGDLHRIVDSFQGQVKGFQRAVELQGLMPAIRNPGLDATCRAVLGCSLDKSMQTSDWSLRPLSEQQQHYAAADAYVLLLLFSAVGVELSAASTPPLLAARERLESCKQQMTDKAVQHARPMIANQVLNTQQNSAVQPLDRTDVQEALIELGLCASASSFQHTRTCTDQTGVSVKTIALMVNQTELVVCVLRLDARIQLSRCAAAIGAKRCEMRMVREEMLVSIVGYPRGAIGPIGLRTLPRAILLDEDLASESKLLCGAGEEGWVYEISGQALLGSLDMAFVCNIHE